MNEEPKKQSDLKCVQISGEAHAKFKKKCEEEGMKMKVVNELLILRFLKEGRDAL